jgi:hypothetical protein
MMRSVGPRPDGVHNQPVFASRVPLANSASVRRINLSQKCSITLYQTDLEIFDQIRELFRGNWVRNLSDSAALPFARRSVRHWRASDSLREP